MAARRQRKTRGARAGNRRCSSWARWRWWWAADATWCGRCCAFKLDRPARWLFALALCQIGEFAFVLFSLGVQSHVIPQEVAAPLVAATALTMLLTPLVFVLLERVVLPKVTVQQARAHD